MDGVNPPQSSASSLSPGMMDGMMSKGMHPVGTGEHVPIDNHSSNGGSPIPNGHHDDILDNDSSMDGSILEPPGGGFSQNDPEMPKLTAS